MNVRWLRGGAVALTVVLMGIGVEACGGSQVAVPAGPGNASPSSKASSSAAGSPSADPSPSSSTRATTNAKQAPPVRPHGNIKQHAKTHPVKVEGKKQIAQKGSFSDGVQVTVTRLHAVTAKPVGPGEVGGPAVAATVKITNGSSVPVDLSTISVGLLGSNGSPGIMSTGSGTNPLTGDLAVGASSSGTYVFTVSKSLRKPVTVQIVYGSGQTVLQFSGNA